MLKWIKSILEEGVYPPPLFRRRLDEEVSRARRCHGIVALAFFRENNPDVTQTIRENVRQMDVVGYWKRCSAILMPEITPLDGQTGWSDRLIQIFRAILRLANAANPDHPLHIGACLLPEKKNGKIACQTLLSGAEMALAAAVQERQPVIYTGLLRFPVTEKVPQLPAVVRVGDLNIDREHMKVVVGSEAHSLRRKEFDLLSYLLKNAGKTVTRENIFRMVWDSEYFSSTRTIDFHVAQVRKVLQPSRCLQIQTVKGLGYRLERMD